MKYDADTTRKWQTRLAGLGYYTATIDGVYGPKTREATKKYQTWLRDHGFEVGTIDGWYGPITAAADLEYRKSQETRYVTLLPPEDRGFRLTPEGRKMVYHFEIGGGKAYYDAKLAVPTWPGYSSGVTIGIGYDLGYVTASQFYADWRPHLTLAQLDALAQGIGVCGASAQAIAKRASHVKIPFSAAEQVFDTVTVARYWDRAKAALPGIEQLAAPAKDALWSLGYNRGWSMSSADSRKEMRELPPLVRAKNYAGIASAIERMTRLWPENEKSDADLCDRRRAEAKLVRSCL